MGLADLKYQLEHVWKAAQQHVEQRVQNEVQHYQAICYFVEYLTDCTSGGPLCQQNGYLEQLVIVG